MKVSLSLENMKREEKKKGKARVSCGKAMEALEEREWKKKAKRNQPSPAQFLGDQI